MVITKYLLDILEVERVFYKDFSVTFESFIIGFLAYVAVKIFINNIFEKVFRV
jgi:hypothetical protein